MTAVRVRRSRRFLIVGVGLTGAALAWLAARAGHHVLVAPAGRNGRACFPAGAAVVRGTVLPEPLAPRGALDRPASCTALAALAQRGERILFEALMAAGRSCGLRAIPSERHLAGPDAEVRAAALAGLLRATGAEPVVEAGANGVVVRREDDLLLSTRRLTFELLRLARRAGARWLGREPFGAIRVRGDAAEVEIGGSVEPFDRAFWTCAGPDDRAPFAEVLPRRALLVQTLRPGPKALSAALRFDAFLLLPGAQGLPVIRTLQPGEPPPPGVSAPRGLTEALAQFAGPLVRQELVEEFIAPPALEADAPGPALTVVPSATWPLATLFGCLDRYVGNSASAAAG